MSFESAFALFGAVILIGYLTYALLRPEKF